MTSEIAVMNRQAAVLAADSAGTVTAWVNGREEKRYFKGENKIFQCSDHHPVGLMTFGNADLQRIPWELIIKSFRRDLGDKTFNDVSDYAIELFKFINHNVDIFPYELRDQFFISEVVKVGLKYLVAASEDDGVKAATQADLRKEAYSEFLSNREELIESSSLCEPFDREDINRALTTHATEIRERFLKWLEKLDLKEYVDCEQLHRLAVTALLKQYGNHLSETGIVVAGYGDKDYLPRLVEYRCYGNFLGKVLFEEKARHEITLDKTSEIVGFASTAMVERWRRSRRV